MSELKISQLTEASNVASSDLVLISQDQGASVYASKKVTWANVIAKTSTSLIYAANVQTDLSTGDIFKLTLTGDVNMDDPVNGADGKTYVWRISQDSSGGHAVTLGSKFKVPSSATVPLAWSTASNAMDIFCAQYDEDTDLLYVVSLIPGYNL